MKMFSLLVACVALGTWGCAWFQPSDAGGRDAATPQKSDASGRYLGSPVGSESGNERNFKPPAIRGR
jgi:hypothetical protein